MFNRSFFLVNKLINAFQLLKTKYKLLSLLFLSRIVLGFLIEVPVSILFQKPIHQLMTHALRIMFGQLPFKEIQVFLIQTFCIIHLAYFEISLFVVTRCLYEIIQVGIHITLLLNQGVQAR